MVETSDFQGMTDSPLAKIEETPAEQIQTPIETPMRSPEVTHKKLKSSDFAIIPESPKRRSKEKSGARIFAHSNKVTMLQQENNVLRQRLSDISSQLTSIIDVQVHRRPIRLRSKTPRESRTEQLAVAQKRLQLAEREAKSYQRLIKKITNPDYKTGIVSRVTDIKTQLSELTASNRQGAKAIDQNDKKLLKEMDGTTAGIEDNRNANILSDYKVIQNKLVNIKKAQERTQQKLEETQEKENKLTTEAAELEKKYQPPTKEENLVEGMQKAKKECATSLKVTESRVNRLRHHLEQLYKKQNDLDVKEEQLRAIIEERADALSTKSVELRNVQKLSKSKSRASRGHVGSGSVDVYSRNKNT